MFSRAKRFDEKPIGCGADAAYTPKDNTKPVGGVIPKVDRFCELKYSASIKSDNDSVHSDISSQVFRTPKTVRRMPVVLSSKKVLNNDELLAKELLEAKNVEIRNKNETIAEYENQIKELTEKINESNKREAQLEDIYNELQIKTDLQINDEKEKSSKSLRELEENFTDRIVILKNQIEDLKSTISSNKIQMDEFSESINELRQQKEEKEFFIKELQTRLQDAENQNENLREMHDKSISNLKDEIEKLSKEKSNFSVTLETTRQTVDVLGSRLRNSDEHVERLKDELEEALSLNTSYETQLTNLKKEYGDFKTEYNKVLITIVESKSTLDKNHQKILQDNNDLVESLHMLESEVWSAITTLKEDLLNDIDLVKKMSHDIVNCYESKLVQIQKEYTDMKIQCDSAFEKINECQQLLASAEAQIENKDQELNEISTENVQMSGTLMALEQEKNELQTLSAEFLKLLNAKNRTIHDCMKKIEDYETVLVDNRDRVTALTQLLEATEYIVLEKDKEILLQKSEISKQKSFIQTLEMDNAKELSKCENKIEDLQFENENQKRECEILEKKMAELNLQDSKELKNIIRAKDNEISELVKKIDDIESHMLSCEEEFLRKHCNVLKAELEDITSKYTNLLGHQNNKQKIKHVADLKIQNNTLKEKIEKLHFTIENQNTVIEKLKRQMADSAKVQSPILSKKQFSHIPINSGKENIGDMSLSPSRLGSPQANVNRPLTPLRDSNR